MMKLLSAIICILTLSACGKEDVCKDFQLEICDNCAISEYEEEVTCACLEDGEVEDWRDYFDTKTEAELHCSGVKNNHAFEYVGPDRLAACAGGLEVLKEHGSDACSSYGYEAPRVGSGGWDSGYY